MTIHEKEARDHHELQLGYTNEHSCTTNDTIGQIAIAVGYQNASKFSKAFSSIMGVTPKCFRKNNSITVLEQNSIDGVDNQN